MGWAERFMEPNYSIPTGITAPAGQAASSAAERQRRLRARRRRRIMFVLPLELTTTHLRLLYAGGHISQEQKADKAAVARAVERLLVEKLSPATAKPRLEAGAF